MKVTVWEQENGRVVYTFDETNSTWIEQGVGDTEEDAALALITDLSSRGRQRASADDKRWFLEGIREAAAKYFERQGETYDKIELTQEQGTEVLSQLNAIADAGRPAPDGLAESIALLERLLGWYIEEATDGEG